MKDKKKKEEEISIGSELRKIQDVPFDRLSIQLGVGLDTAKLIHNLIGEFLSRYEEEGEDSERPIFFHKPGCMCKWCKPR